MDSEQKIKNLEAKAADGGFRFERDGRIIFIEREGVGYMFRTDAEEMQLDMMIQKAESFIDDMIGMSK
jgi:hypothetical protein